MKSLLYFSYALPLIKGFFFCGIYLSILTLILVSIPCWFLYNGFIEYVLMLAIFLISIGEMLPCKVVLEFLGLLRWFFLVPRSHANYPLSIYCLLASGPVLFFFFLIGLTVGFVGFSSPILVPLDLQGIPFRSFHFLFHMNRLDSLSVSLCSEYCS